MKVPVLPIPALKAKTVNCINYPLMHYWWLSGDTLLIGFFQAFQIRFMSLAPHNLYGSGASRKCSSGLNAFYFWLPRRHHRQLPSSSLIKNDIFRSWYSAPGNFKIFNFNTQLKILTKKEITCISSVNKITMFQIFYFQIYLIFVYLFMQKVIGNISPFSNYFFMKI